VADERRPSADYRWARQVAALLLIGVVVVIVVLDVLVDDYAVSSSRKVSLSGREDLNPPFPRIVLPAWVAEALASVA
jgi:hypothetical protein